MFQYLIVVFFVLTISALSSNRDGAHQAVHVNFIIGTEDPSCGLSTQPCNNLETALNKSTDKVVISGTIKVNSSIAISRNVVICGNMEEHQPSTIKGEDMSKETAFKLESEIKLTIIGISFIDIGMVDLSKKNTEVSIHNCFAKGNVDKVFRFLGQHSTLTVINTTFSKVVNVIKEDNLHAAIAFKDSAFNNISGCGVCGDKLTDSLTFIRCSFVDAGVDKLPRYASLPRSMQVAILNSHSLVIITDCNFTNTQQRETYAVIDIREVASLSITGTRFNNLFSMYTVVAVRGTTNVVLHNNTFDHNKAESYGIVRVEGCRTISIDNCYFMNNIGGKYSPVRIVPYDNSPMPITSITNTFFQNNSADEEAHNIYSIGHLTLRYVTVVSAHVSSLLNQIVNQVGKFSAEHVRINIQKSAVATGNNGVRVLSPQIKKLSSVTFSCPVNFNVDFDLNYESVTKVYNSLSFKCVSCTKGTYSLKSGKLQLSELTTKYDKYVKEGRVECTECPVGGKCEDGELRASPNFWGFRKSNHVSFVPCPIGYCCNSEGTPCTSYNTCRKGRKGVLCGNCKKGYRLNFFNDSCIEKSGKCSNSLYTSYTTIYSLSITLFFAYVTNITDALKRFWIRFKRKLRCPDALKKVWIHLKIDTTFFSKNERLILDEEETDTISQNGTLKKSTNKIPKLAVFHLYVFFYQLANLLHVKVEKQNSKNGFLKYMKRKITNFVYFRFVVHVHEHVCPTTEINFLDKKGIVLVFNLSTLTNLLLFFIAWRLIVLLKKKIKIHSWLQCLTTSRIIFQRTDILGQCTSWWQRNVSIPVIERRNRRQDTTQSDPEDYVVLYRHFGDDENIHFQEPNQDTNQVPMEAQTEMHIEDQIRIHDQDQKPTSSRYQKQENKQGVINDGNEQSANLSLQRQQLLEEDSEQINLQGQLKYEDSDEEQNREEDTGEIQQDVATLDILPLYESDSDGEVPVQDGQDQLFDFPDTEDEELRPMLFTIRLKLTLIKLLKTIYTPVTEVCFQLVFCISLNGVKHLYLYGDLVCFTWWQNIILIIVLPGLISFPLTFGMSLHLVQTHQITCNKFLVAAGVPYYAIYLYLKKLVVGLPTPVFSVEDDVFASEILKSYEEVFRHQNKLISWPVVQLYRNFIVTSVKIFIIDPMYRSLMFLPILCVFFIHDRAAKPFLNKSVNVLQTSSTVCLTMIVICNMIFSFSLYMSNIDTIPHMNTVLIILSYVESIVYFIFPLMLPISIVWRQYIVKEKKD